MPSPNPQALEFMLTRRSRPAKTLQGPAPDADRLKVLLTAAARSPDHGKLEPWRFIVLQGNALQRLAAAVGSCGTGLDKTPDEITKAQAAFSDSPLCVAIVESQKDSAKVPAIEQSYSSGAVCLALLNAALADGWGANWLSGWASHDRGFVEGQLGLAANERVAGFIHIGTERIVPPERPRPDLDSITTWVSS
ncbi:nitroreductase family protein [Pelagimonas varians]|uniref:Putative NAD(P)H nitroreductase n=1 Tax=Pelagimonas varians TaxID=696760 RepID=A0A238L4L5_9RHOB|nr:nitroreductase [Pelagimonas varians]PYG26419.1 nitroreductase [Pelagimonas varians]SMX49969.1 Putative NAD(P)H nitroreductase YdjA [Pelagimonas varians]